MKDLLGDIGNRFISPEGSPSILEVLSRQGEVLRKLDFVH